MKQASQEQEASANSPISHHLPPAAAQHSQALLFILFNHSLFLSPITKQQQQLPMVERMSSTGSNEEVKAVVSKKAVYGIKKSKVGIAPPPKAQVVQQPPPVSNANQPMSHGDKIAAREKAEADEASNDQEQASKMMSGMSMSEELRLKQVAEVKAKKDMEWTSSCDADGNEVTGEMPSTSIDNSIERGSGRSGKSNLQINANASSTAPKPHPATPHPSTGTGHLERKSSRKEEKEGLRRSTLTEKVRQTYSLRNIDPESVSEDAMAEEIGSTFNGLWGNLGLGGVARSLKSGLSTSSSMLSGLSSSLGLGKDADKGDDKDDGPNTGLGSVRPMEVLERITASFPKKAYKGFAHTSMAPVVDQRQIWEKLEQAETAEQAETRMENEAAAAVHKSEEAARLAAAVRAPVEPVRNMKAKIMKPNFVYGPHNPLHVLSLSPDEIDYFYGAFIEASQYGNYGEEDDFINKKDSKGSKGKKAMEEAAVKEKAPTQISLHQLVAWFYRNENKFKCRMYGKKVKGDEPFLRQNIESVYWYDGKEKNAEDNDAKNYSKSAKNVGGKNVPPPAPSTSHMTFEQTKELMLAKGKGQQIFMTFL
jgi:hypothetical protein